MRRSRSIRRIVLVGLAALLGLFLVVLFARHSIATFFVSRVLARKGFDCGPISVHVPLPPSKLELAATRCKVAEGPLESVEFKEPLSIKLGGLEISALECASLEVNLRSSTHKEVDLNTLGDLSRLMGLDQLALELMFGTAKLASDPNPPLRAAQAVLRLAGKQVSSYRDLEVISNAAGMTITSPAVQLDQAALLGAGVLRLTATPTAVTVTVVFAGDLKVKVVLDHIDASRPSADFEISIGSSRAREK